jgi:hypothetical protein
LNTYGESANSTQASATPVGPPSAPTGLAATSGNARVGLSWTAATGATSYHVKRSTVGGSGYVVAGSPTGVTYTDTGLVNNTTYYYVVSALNPSGESGNSAQVSATPRLPVPFDFNGDGDPDLTLQSTGSNQASFWFMNNNSVIGVKNLSVTIPAGWKLVGERDFNGDGNTDLVLQNTSTSSAAGKVAIWYMNGTTQTGGGYVSTSLPSGWNICAVADFNGDGHPDLCLQNTTSNKVAIWYLNGLNVTGSAYVSITPGSGWKVAAAADFNGDGKPDLVLQNVPLAKAAIWHLNNATYMSGAYVSINMPSGWSIVGAADFNKDGKTDLVLQNNSTYKIAFWYMTDTTVNSSAYASSTPSAGWQVVAPK